MYERLPFDSPQTLRELGEKLFTRIRKEEEQAVIRAFLAQPPHSECLGDSTAAAGPGGGP